MGAEICAWASAGHFAPTYCLTLPASPPIFRHPMPDSFTSPTQTGFSQRAGEGWSVELLGGLDWLRMGELLRAIVVNVGCELGPSRVQADGAIEFAMLEAPGQKNPRRALVKLAAWNHWGATPEVVQGFASQVKRILPHAGCPTRHGTPGSRCPPSHSTCRTSRTPARRDRASHRRQRKKGGLESRA